MVVSNLYNIWSVLTVGAEQTNCLVTKIFLALLCQPANLIWLLSATTDTNTAFPSLFDFDFDPVEIVGR